MMLHREDFLPLDNDGDEGLSLSENDDDVDDGVDNPELSAVV